jgi:hypothetical protein
VQIGGVVEIVPTPTGELPAMLVATVYRASRWTPIMLVLRSTTRREVDRLLDPVVRREGVDVKGLLYTDAEDEHAVIAVARGASVVVACTDAFQTALTACGVSWCSASAAPQRLLTLTEPPHPRAYHRLSPGRDSRAELVAR